MRTPSGKECPYYYADFHRARSLQECRLLAPAEHWEPTLCSDCPVPGIVLANGCTDMTLRAHVKRAGFLWLRRGVRIQAYCRKTSRVVEEPRVGCGECHPAILFSIADSSDEI